MDLFSRPALLRRTGRKRKEKNMKAEEAVSLETVCIVTDKYV